MTTTPVANTASSAPSSSAGRSNASRKAESAGNPFQQMLSEEIAGKATSGNKASERTADANASNKPAPAPSGEKSADSAASAADKIRQEADKAARKENSDENHASALSPELAAMVARLLQQRAASGEAAADDGTSDQADPLAALTQTLQHKLGDAQTTQAELSDLGDPRLAAAGKGAQDALPADGQPASDVDLQAAAGTKLAVEGGEGGQTTEFSNVLQQLSQTAQAGQARQAQAAPATHLAPKVGTSGWDQALGQRVVWMATGTEQSASLTLNPPELGPLQVVLNLTNNQANATFVAPHAEVRQALEAAMPKLREMLGEAGIQLDQASVNQGTPQQQGEFARPGSQGGSRGQGGGQGHDGGAQTTAESPAVRRVTAAGNGLVDTFA
jgi:flagellar hook-length control protein FliK